MPLYSFRCPAGHAFDKRVVSYDTTLETCACGAEARRAEVNLTSIVGETVMKPVKYRVSEFQEAHQEVDYAYSKVEQETGEKVKRPDLWKAAKQEARRRGAPIR